jgi:uncharacterized oligopeptide transporter (OPT) family protein
MKLRNILFSIATALIALWVLGVVLKIAGWFIHVVIMIAAILIIIGIIRVFIDNKKGTI